MSMLYRVKYVSSVGHSQSLRNTHLQSVLIDSKAAQEIGVRYTNDASGAVDCKK